MILRMRLGLDWGLLGMSFSEWKEKTLGEIGEIIGGGTPSTKNSDFYGGNIPWITPKDLSKYSERYIYTGDRLITETGLCNSSAKMMPKNSVLFSSRAPIGYIAIAGNDLCTNQGFKSIIVDQNISDSCFIYYLLKYRRDDIISIGSGTTFMEVSGTVFKNFKVKIPSLLEQKLISATLSCLDEKIEINNKMNKNLEEMSQAIYKSWFVDFEPFQDGKFNDSELGSIPKDWTVVKISEVTRESNTGGDAIQKTPMVDNDTGIKCVRVGDLTNQRGFDKWGFTNVNEENFKKYQLKENDIVVTRTATLGLNQFIDEDLMAVYNNGLIRIKLNEKVIPLFFYHSINTDKYKEYIGRIEGDSSTRPNMKINYLLSYKLVYPPIEIQEKFVDIISEIRKQRSILYKQTNNLNNVRDTLLPKLMSGEIRIPKEEMM